MSNKIPMKIPYGTSMSPWEMGFHEGYQEGYEKGFLAGMSKRQARRELKKPPKRAQESTNLWDVKEG